MASLGVSITYDSRFIRWFLVLSHLITAVLMVEIHNVGGAGGKLIIGFFKTFPFRPALIYMKLREYNKYAHTDDEIMQLSLQRAILIRH